MLHYYGSVTIIAHSDFSILLAFVLKNRRRSFYFINWLYARYSIRSSRRYIANCARQYFRSRKNIYLFFPPFRINPIVDSIIDFCSLLQTRAKTSWCVNETRESAVHDRLTLQRPPPSERLCNGNSLACSAPVYISCVHRCCILRFGKRRQIIHGSGVIQFYCVNLCYSV